MNYNRPNCDAELHLQIIGARDNYHCVAKNHNTKNIINAWLTKEEICPWATKKNNEGFTVWVSLNDKEKNIDNIKGVSALCDFWLDIDAKRPDKSVKATEEELQEALERATKLLDHLEKTYGAVGFLASSGNGFHMHFPLNRFELIGEKFRVEINEKVKAFAKKVSKKVKAEIDRAYDIRRVTTLIGTLNLKIPDQPLKTTWDKNVFFFGYEEAVKNVNAAREHNKKLLEAILNTNTENKAATSLPVKPHQKIHSLLIIDPELNTLYTTATPTGERSEKEMKIVCKLKGYGFTDSEIREVMEECAAGKWQECGEKYQEHTLKNADKYLEGQNEKKKESKTDRKKNSEPKTPPVIVDLGNSYALEEKGDSCYLVDPNKKILDCCYIKSVAGQRFRKILRERTKLCQEVIAEKTTAFKLLTSPEELQEPQKSNEAEKKDKKQQKSSAGFYQDGTIFEQIEDNKYVYGKEGKQLEIIELDDIFYSPYEKIPWKVANQLTPFEGLNNLRKEIKTFIKAHLFVMEPAHYDILTSWIIASWIQAVSYTHLTLPTILLV